MANLAPDSDSWCAEVENPGDVPVIRFVAGAQLEPQVDVTRGQPTSCSLTIDTIGNLQAALFAFQPLLTVIDTLATLGQCTLLMSEVISNPFKIPDLLACIPGLVGKINKLLQLVPIFPQGIQAFVTFVVDVLRFIGTQIDCVVQILRSFQRAQEELARLAREIDATLDEGIKAGLQSQYDCSSQILKEDLSLTLGGLGPIARLLCQVRFLLSLVPGGKDVQKYLVFPDPTNIEVLDDAIAALQTTRDVLLATEDAIVALTAGLGALPPPTLTFNCPDLESVETEEPEPVPVPEITNLTELGGGILINPSAGDTEKLVRIVGTNMAFGGSQNKVFFGTAPLPEDDVLLLSDTEVQVRITEGFLKSAGTYQLAIVNSPEGAPAAFSGLSEDPGVPADTGVEVSNQVDFTVD